MVLQASICPRNSTRAKCRYIRATVTFSLLLQLFWQALDAKFRRTWHSLHKAARISSSPGSKTGLTSSMGGFFWFLLRTILNPVTLSQPPISFNRTRSWLRQGQYHLFQANFLGSSKVEPLHKSSSAARTVRDSNIFKWMRWLHLFSRLAAAKLRSWHCPGNTANSSRIKANALGAAGWLRLGTETIPAYPVNPHQLIHVTQTLHPLNCPGTAAQSYLGTEPATPTQCESPASAAHPEPRDLARALTPAQSAASVQLVFFSLLPQQHSFHQTYIFTAS